MSEIEKIIHKFLKEQITPVIESSVIKAVKQALADQNKAALPEKDPYYNAKKSAAYIDDKLSTFYKRIHRKEIPRHGPTKRIFCKKSDLDAFISQQQGKTIRQMHAEVEEALISKPKRRGRRKAA